MTFIAISKKFNKNFQFQFWIDLNFETLSSTKTKTEFLFIQCNQNQKFCAISEFIKKSANKWQKLNRNHLFDQSVGKKTCAYQFLNVNMSLK